MQVYLAHNKDATLTSALESRLNPAVDGIDIDLNGTTQLHQVFTLRLQQILSLRQQSLHYQQ